MPGFICHLQQEARRNVFPFLSFLEAVPVFTEKRKMAALGQIC